MNEQEKPSLLIGLLLLASLPFQILFSPILILSVLFYKEQPCDV